MSITKVLCLHGCNQSEETFRSLFKGWKTIPTQNNLELHFLQATKPHSLGGYTWYEEELDVAQIGRLRFDTKRITPCLKRLHAYIQEHNITTLLGYSQGGNVVDTYLARYHGQTPIERAIIFCGYELVDPERRLVDTLVLSVYSEADTIVPAKYRPIHYTNLLEYKHDNGHKLPKGNPVIRQLCGFLRTGVFSL